MSSTNNEVGKRIKALREKKGLTQLHMANFMGVTQSNYGRLEKGDSRIDVMRLFLIANLLQTSTTWLLHGTGRENQMPSNIRIIETDDKTIITINK